MADMIESNCLATEGVVVRGYRIASGEGGDTRFPGGTIRRQFRFFRAAISDFDDWFGGTPYPATINVSFGSRQVKIVAPEYVVRRIRWTHLFPPEDFFLSRASLTVHGRRHPVMLYIPDPQTKPDHHQAASVVELLAAFIPGLAYGVHVRLDYPEYAILIQ